LLGHFIGFIFSRQIRKIIMNTDPSTPKRIGLAASSRPGLASPSATSALASPTASRLSVSRPAMPPSSPIASASPKGKVPVRTVAGHPPSSNLQHSQRFFPASGAAAVPPSPKSQIFSPKYKDRHPSQIAQEERERQEAAEQAAREQAAREQAARAQALAQQQAAAAAAASASASNRPNIYGAENVNLFYLHQRQIYAQRAQAAQMRAQGLLGPDAMDFEDEFDPFLFIKHLGPIPLEYRISLVLDLDETLVHCSVELIPNYELTFPVQFNGIEYQVYVRKRPHLAEFLAKVSQWFEVIIFTASQKVYADKLLNILDPEKRFIKHRLFRDSCVCVDGNYLKDLSVVNRGMNEMCIIDNSPQAFSYQVDNGIPIESWFDDDTDEELLNILPFLETFINARDIRPLIRRQFGMQALIDSL
jgi:CTD small phosphatase-like protein 2